MRIRLVLMAYVLIFLFLALPIASAGLGVSGAIVDRKVDPGDTFVHDMTVSSDSDSPPMDIVVEILGLNQSIEGENMELKKEENTGPYSAHAFLTASPERFYLAPGESRNVLVEGTIPANATPGGRYALVNIHSLPIGNGTIGIVVAIDIPVRLTIQGPGLMKTGKIESLELEEPISPRQQNFSLIFKNTGNLHYKARADAVLKDKDGNTIASTSTPLSSNIIPDASRLFRIAFASEEGLKPGVYCINATVKQEDGSILVAKEVQFRL